MRTIGLNDCQGLDRSRTMATGPDRDVDKRTCSAVYLGCKHSHNFSLSPGWNAYFCITIPRIVFSQASIMHLLIEAFFLVYLAQTFSALGAESGPLSTALGKACSIASNRLDPRTRRFTSDCDAQTFCSGTINGTCVPRQCRREEFPFGYRADQTPPALCPAGSFCPDEGDACRPLVAVGQPCQFNRDDQCAPSNTPELADYHNFNGAVCLRSVCT